MTPVIVTALVMWALMSRDLRLVCQKHPYTWNHRPWFAYLVTVQFIELRREQNGRLYPNVLLLIHLYRRFSEFHQKDLRLLTSDPTESGVHIEPTSIYFGFSISCEFLTHFLSNPLPLFATHEARAAACVCVVCASPCRLRYCTIVLLSYISPLCTNSVPGDVVYIMWGVSAWWRDSNATAEM